MRTEQLQEQTYKFIPGKIIAETELSFASPQEALGSPLGKKLFGFPWTETVKITTDSVELTKKDWVDWDILLEPLQGLLEEHFATHTALEKPVKPAGSDTTSSEAAQIKEFIPCARFPPSPAPSSPPSPPPPRTPNRSA